MKQIIIILVLSFLIEGCRSAFSSNIVITIPGHGKTGGTELLDYTLTLFETNKNDN